MSFAPCWATYAAVVSWILTDCSSKLQAGGDDCQDNEANMFLFDERSALNLTTIDRGAFERILIAAMGLLIVILPSVPVMAAETLFTSRAAYETALGAFRVITFEPDQGFSVGLLPSFDGGRIQTRSELGNHVGPASIIDYGDPNQVLVGTEEVGPQPNSNVRLLFSEPQFAIGFDAIGARETVVIDVTYLDNSTSQHIFDGGDINPSPFFGLLSDIGFRDVFIMGANRGDPNNPGEQPNHIDNLTLISEPSTGALITVVCLTVLTLRRKGARANKPLD